MALSIVSPKILYFPSLYAITCVLPPETYNIVGLSAFVTQRPISIWPTQWLTPIKGFLYNWLNVLITKAPTDNGWAIPGPFV